MQRTDERDIYTAISKLRLKFGDRQANLTSQIAEISGDQVFFNNVASAIASISFSKSIGISAAGPSASVGGSVSLGLFSYFINAGYQKEKEVGKGRLKALKERKAAQEHAELNSLQDDLLDLDFKIDIRRRLLEMNLLAIESAQAVGGLRLATAQLAALHREKEDLERRKAESRESLTDRYFADPSHRLLTNASLLRSEYSFANAQRWMFLAIRAAEYKWNETFEYMTDTGALTTQTLFGTRNARELDELFHALQDWDKQPRRGRRNDDMYKKFSFRQELLRHKFGVGPDDKDNLTAFRSFVAQKANHLDPSDPGNPIPGFKVLRLRFSTAFTPETGGLFMRNRWNEKVNFLRVKLHGGARVGINPFVDGYLKYGGVSLIRNRIQVPHDPHTPNYLVNDTTEYSTRHWSYENGQWHSEEGFGASIQIEVSRDPDVPAQTREINVFQEYSVATSEWTLYVALENKHGSPLIDLGALLDIEFHIHYYYYSLN